jgi:peptidoglycan hydrolase CwlO-like protein
MMGMAMWRWLYQYLFHGFVMEVYDVNHQRQQCADRHIEDLRKDVKRLYNLTHGTQALENLLEKKLAAAMSDIDQLKKRANCQQKALCARTLEMEQSLHAVENRVVDLYNTGLNLFHQLRQLQDRVDDLKASMKSGPSKARQANALMAPRDSKGRFRRKDGQTDQEAE